MKRPNTPALRRKGAWALPTAIWWVTVLFLAFVVVYPSATLVINSFQTENGYGLSNYAVLFSDKGIINSMGNSMKLAIPSTLTATTIGVFLAWAVVRTDVPGKRVWQTLLSVPYFIPPFIGAIAWTFLLGPVGVFNKLLMDVFQRTEPVFNIYSIPGMVFVMSIYRYAVPFIVVLPTMQKIPAAMEEASRISGATPWRTLRTVTLPLLAPSIIGAMLLLFLFILADFGVASVLGAPNQIRMMTTHIYYLINRPDMPNNLQIASAYSIFLALFGLVGLFLHNRVLKTNKFAVVSGKSASVEPLRLGRARWVLFAVLTFVFLLTTCSPILATLVTSFTKVYGLPFGGTNMTFQNFTKLLDIANITRAFQNSLFLAVVSAVLITGITLIIAYIAVRGGVRRVRGVRFMQTMVTLPYAVPGTIIALGMILAFAQPLPVVGWKLYGTIWILLAAYMARFMNLGYNNIAGAISQVDPSLEEAARISGATHMRSFRDIMLPLLKNSLFSSTFLVLPPTLAEITLSALLWSVGNETIGTVVFSAQEEGKILRTAALAIMLILLVVLIHLLVQWLGERSKKRAAVYTTPKEP